MPIHLKPSVGTQYSMQLPQNMVGTSTEKKTSPVTYLLLYPKKDSKVRRLGEMSAGYYGHLRL